MFLSGLSLQHFRNYVSAHFSFDPLTTVIVAPNAYGKTSIIEAIHLLATGESFRAEKVEEMIAYERELARVKALLIDDDEEKTALEMMLTRGMVQGKKTSLRLYSVNDIRRRKKEFTQHFKTVVFRPEDMRLIEGSPGRRRSFINTPLTQLDAEYAHSLTTYDQTLLRRNRLLEQVREREQPATVLTFWNKSLIKHGEYLQQQRRQFFDFLTTVPFSVPFSINYQPSLISEARQLEYIDREIASGHTLVGPHKDDFSVLFQPLSFKTQESNTAFASGERKPEFLPVETYGSRGQQRLAVLWLKIAELTYINEHTQQPPLLLLDDILSELDETSQNRVYDLLGKQQTIITTIDPDKAAEIKTKISAVKQIDL